MGASASRERGPLRIGGWLPQREPACRAGSARVAGARRRGWGSGAGRRRGRGGGLRGLGAGWAGALQSGRPEKRRLTRCGKGAVIPAGAEAGLGVVQGRWGGPRREECWPGEGVRGEGGGHGDRRDWRAGRWGPGPAGRRARASGCKGQAGRRRDWGGGGGRRGCSAAAPEGRGGTDVRSRGHGRGGRVRGLGAGGAGVRAGDAAAGPTWAAPHSGAPPGPGAAPPAAGPLFAFFFLPQQPRPLQRNPPAAEGGLCPAAGERGAGSARGARLRRGAPPGGQRGNCGGRARRPGGRPFGAPARPGGPHAHGALWVPRRARPGRRRRRSGVAAGPGGLEQTCRRPGGLRPSGRRRAGDAAPGRGARGARGRGPAGVDAGAAARPPPGGPGAARNLHRLAQRGNTPTPPQELWPAGFGRLRAPPGGASGNARGRARGFKGD